MLRDLNKITVNGEHNKVMVYAELRQQRIDRFNLHAGFAATIVQLCRLYMVMHLRHQNCQSRKLLDDLGSRPGANEALQKFLQHQSSHEYLFATASKHPAKRLDFRHRFRNISTKGKRPDARVGKQAHLKSSFLSERPRSFL